MSFTKVSSTPIKGPRTCDHCKGKKTVIVDLGGFGLQAKCPTCKGTGVLDDPNARKKCNGSKTEVVQMGEAGSEKSVGIEVDCTHCEGIGIEPGTLPRHEVHTAAA